MRMHIAQNEHMHYTLHYEVYVQMKVWIPVFHGNVYMNNIRIYKTIMFKTNEENNLIEDSRVVVVCVCTLCTCVYF